MRATLICLPLLAGLAACDVESNVSKPGPDEAGTSVSIKASDNDGSDVRIETDGKTGQTVVKLPGIDARVSLPKMVLTEKNFDIDGVKLFPGSTVSSVDVKAESKPATENATVKIAFSAPADVAAVRDWFVKAFAEKSMTITQQGNVLSGRTKEGTPFTLTLAPDKGKSTTGSFVFDESGAS